MSDKNTFGDFLREYITTNKISTHQLSEMSGVSQPYISQIINGKKPSGKIVKKISNALNVDFRYLMHLAGYIEEESPLEKIDWSIRMVESKLSEKYRQREAIIREFSDIHWEDEKVNKPDKHDYLMKVQAENINYIKILERNLKELIRLRKEVEEGKIIENLQLILLYLRNPELKNYNLKEGEISELDIEEAEQIQRSIESIAGKATNVIELENLFNIAQEITINGRNLTEEEKERALQILKLTFDK